MHEEAQCIPGVSYPSASRWTLYTSIADVYWGGPNSFDPDVGRPGGGERSILTVRVFLPVERWSVVDTDIRKVPVDATVSADAIGEKKEREELTYPIYHWQRLGLSPVIIYGSRTAPAFLARAKVSGNGDLATLVNREVVAHYVGGLIEDLTFP